MVETKTTTERRAYVRVPFLADGEGTVLVTAAGETHPLQVRTRDLSAGGIGAYARQPPPRTALTPEVGDELQVALRMPFQPEPVPFRARVAWVRRAGRGAWFTWNLGAEFLDVSPHLRERMIHAVLEIQRRHLR